MIYDVMNNMAPYLNETYAIMENGNLSKAADEIIDVIEKELGR